MPRNYKRTPGFRTYHDCTDETLQKCLSLVKANKISMKAGSRKHSIPYGTIRNKINGWHSKQYGGQKQLSGSFENTLKTLKLYDPFLWMGFNYLKATATSRRQFTFTIHFPEIPDTHVIDVGKVKGWVDLGAIQWFWTRGPWIGNPAP